MRIVLRALALLSMVGSLQVVHAAIVNIDAKLNTTTNPVSIFLEAGTYIVNPIGISEGGSYDSWLPWATVTCSNTNGCDASQISSFHGWIHTYNVQSSNITSVEVNGTVLSAVGSSPPLPDAALQTFYLDTPAAKSYNVGTDFTYPNAGLAFGSAVPSSFTLAAAGLVGFSILDDPYTDNSGGVSLNLSAVPAPAAAWLFGSALLGLAGFSKRRSLS